VAVYKKSKKYLTKFKVEIPSGSTTKTGRLPVEAAYESKARNNGL